MRKSPWCFIYTGVLPFCTFLSIWLKPLRCFIYTGVLPFCTFLSIWLKPLRCFIYTGLELLELEAPANPPKISEMHEIPMKSIKMACRLVIPGASTLGTFLSKFGRGPEVLHRHGGASILHISLDSAETPEVLHRHGGASILHISLDLAEIAEVLHRQGAS